MTIECCDNAGGRVIITANGKRYSSRGGVTIRPTTFEKVAGANDDGSIYTTTRAVTAEASFTLTDRCGLNIKELIEGCHIDVSFDLFDMKKKYLFSRATVIGRPEYSTESGEIRGLSIVSALVSELAHA